MLESDNKENSKKRYCWETWNVVERVKNREATLVGGCLHFHLSWIATSGKKLVAKNFKAHVILAVLRPPKSETNY
jgi:muramoyltetrapeptide carboxypeptidase LdcA involved in peptidoglycan recycling